MKTLYQVVVSGFLAGEGAGPRSGGKRSWSLRGAWLCAAIVVLLGWPSALSAQKWNQPGGNGRPITLTYSYSENLSDGLFAGGGLNLASGLNQYDVVDLIEEALAVWAKYTPITFVQVPDGANVNIRVGKRHMDQAIGLAHLPPNNYTGSLRMWLRANYNNWGDWTLRYVAAHEFGHNLGLGHTSGTSIMNASSWNSTAGSIVANGNLPSIDISNIRAKYGSGSSGVINTRYWTGPSNEWQNWTNNANWRLENSENSRSWPFRPNANSNVVINRGAVRITGGTVDVRRLDLGQGAGHSGRLSITGGTLRLSHPWGLRIGYNGSGEVAQSGGTVDVRDINLGGSQTRHNADYNLYGGTLRVRGWIKDDGPGISTLRIQGGTLDTSNLGRVTVDRFIFNGTNSGQRLVWDTGWRLWAKSEMVLGNMSGREATLVLRDGTLRVDGHIVGGLGTGNLYLQGGNVNVAGSITVDQLRIGNSYGDFTFNFDRSVTARDFIQVGGARSGTYNQTGGRVETPSLRLSASSGQRSVYNLDGGTLAVNGNITDSTGTSILRLRGGYLDTSNLGNITVDEFFFNGTSAGQTLHWNTGGTLRAKSEMVLGNMSGREATLVLRDGTLRVDGNIVDGPGRGNLDLQGGSVDVSGNITVNELRIGRSGGDFTFDFGRNVTARDFIQVGGARSGTYNQTGGRVETPSLSLSASSGRSSVYNLHGGTLSVGSLDVGADGAGSAGTMVMHGGTLTAASGASVGHSGIGTLEIKAGTATFGGVVNVGDNSGAGGAVIVGEGGGNPSVVVSGGNTNVARVGTGSSFTMYSGTWRQDTNNFVQGQAAGAGTSSVAIHGGTLDVAGGDGTTAGSWNFNQGGPHTADVLGGQVLISGHLNLLNNPGTATFTIGNDAGANPHVRIGGNLNYRAGGTDTFNLRSGTLEFTGGDVHYMNRTGTNAFHWTGGTLEHVGTFDGDLIQGNTDSESRLVIGASPGVMTIPDAYNYTLDAAGAYKSVLQIEIFGDGTVGAGMDFDQLIVGGMASFDASSDIALVLQGYTPVLHDAWQIIDAGSIDVMGDVNMLFDTSAAPLSDLLIWDFGDFANYGTVKVKLVPEPAALALLGLAAAALLLRRRRS